MPRITQTVALSAALCAATMLGSAGARAQDQETGAIDVETSARSRDLRPSGRPAVGAPGPLRLFTGVNIAAGGKLKGESGDGRFDLFDTEGDELFPTIGFHVGVDFVLMDFFSIGGETRFLFPKKEALDDQRDFLWDISVSPRGRYAFDTMPLEIYLGLPIGLTVPGIDGPEEGEIGWNIGVVAGANWFFTENLGVSLEMGWHFHKFGIETTIDTPLFEGTAEIDVRMNQFLFLAPSLVYAL